MEWLLLIILLPVAYFLGVRNGEGEVMKTVLTRLVQARGVLQHEIDLLQSEIKQLKGEDRQEMQKLLIGKESTRDYLDRSIQLQEETNRFSGV